MTKIKKILLLSALFFLFLAPAVNAAPFPSIVPDECRGDQTEGGGVGPCNLTAVETMATNIATIILGVSGSLALLMFVIGGIQYILAGGSAKYVTKAKDTLTYSALGLALVIFAGVLIKFLVKSLTGI